jgi:hypothetical protein
MSLMEIETFLLKELGPSKVCLYARFTLVVHSEDLRRFQANINYNHRVAPDIRKKEFNTQNRTPNSRNKERRKIANKPSEK